MEFKFIITYFFKRCADGTVKKGETRKATIYSNSLNRAIDVVRMIDNNYIDVATIEFEEVRN